MKASALKLNQFATLKAQLPTATRRQRSIVRDHHKRRVVSARKGQHQLENRVGGAAIQIACGLVCQHTGRLVERF